MGRPTGSVDRQIPDEAYLGLPLQLHRPGQPDITDEEQGEGCPVRSRDRGSASYGGRVAPQVDDEHALVRLLPRTGHVVGHCVRRAVAAHGLTPASTRVLRVLAATGPVSHRELAAGLGVAPGTLTPVVDALERAGSVRRDRDAADRRVVRVSITTPGRERLVAAGAEVARALGARVPQPAPEHEVIVRDYLLSVLAALHDPTPQSI